MVPPHLVYLCAPWNRESNGFLLVNKSNTFYRTRRLITAFTSASHLSLSWRRSIQSMPPKPTSWRSSLLLSSHLHMDLPSGRFPSSFPTRSLYTPLLSPIRATCSAHLILLDLITRTILGDENILNASVCSFLHSPFTSSVLGPIFSLAAYFQTSSANVPPSIWKAKIHTHK